MPISESVVTLKQLLSSDELKELALKRLNAAEWVFRREPTVETKKDVETQLNFYLECHHAK